MENNSSSAFLYQNAQTQQPVQHAQPAPVQPPVQEVKNEAPAKEEKPVVKPLVIPPQQLLEQLSGITNNKEFWYLTYRMHDQDYFKLRDEQDKENTIRIRFNSLCTEKNAISRLEYVAKTASHRVDAPDTYHYYSDIGNTKPTKCPTKGCWDNYPFCIPRMNAFIAYHCQNNGMKPEDVYRSILGDDFKPKSPEPQDREFRIPASEYQFLNTSVVTAAAHLIKMDWIRQKENSDNRITYVYLPLCEQTTQSFVPKAIDFYRSETGKYDFLRKDNLKDEVVQSRQCPGCLFPQCPDRVAAYIMALADKYGVDALELAKYISKANMVKGVSERGNFIYLEKLRALNQIDFTSESRAILEKIVRYIVIRWSDAGDTAPFLPFHMAIYTQDDQAAHTAAATFRDTVFYYHYLEKCQILQEYAFSQGGLSGLIEFIEKLEAPTVLHIKEMELLSAEAEHNRNLRLDMTRLNNLIQEKQEKLLVIISGEKPKLDTALGSFSDFYHGTIRHKLTIAQMATGKVVSIILQTLQKDYQLEEGFEKRLEQYIISQYSESPLNGQAFIDYAIQTILFNHFNEDFGVGKTLTCKDIPLVGNRRTQEDIWRDLNELTGLQAVKDEIRSVEQLITLQNKLATFTSTRQQKPNMHMVFAGNPGTGKTTVARLVAEILYNLGFIRQNKLVEASPKDLIGRYIGQTAPKTAAVCESAYDGVLFIDEAYELTVHSNDNNSQFRSECITELIKQMEDNRDRLVVIFAGYTKEMQQLLESNAGFSSRIGRIIQFEDYSTEQLMDMYRHQVRKNSMQLHPDAEAKVVQAIERAQTMEHFGNARYVRNLFENTIREHAKNTAYSEDPQVLLEISAQDIPFI